MSSSIADDEDRVPAGWMGRGCAAAFLGLIVMQEVYGPSLETVAGFRFSDWFLAAILAGGAFWWLVSMGQRRLRRSSLRDAD
jgi:hypothetical protein